MAYVITQPCIGTKDASCVEVCPVDCIHSDDNAEQYFINPDECIDCGACEPECPVEAIYPEDALPAKWEAFTAINAAYNDGVEQVDSLVDAYLQTHELPPLEGFR
ncbi:MAG TPA: ferredoxin family protein [Gaiellaceae bacterium]